MTNLVGRKIIRQRLMTDAEKDALGFYKKTTMYILDDGTIIFPISDDEMNDVGSLAIYTSKQHSIDINPTEQ